MQVYNNSNSIGIKTLLLFCSILFIAYLPVSSCLYFIKNDAFNGYFPPRFFMSESMHAGYLPLWNPYINFGFPQYGDMSSGYWSPFTWFIAATTGYNAYAFTMEIMFYILIGGLGMYKLASVWCNTRIISGIAGCSFMCCGFNIGHLQHVNWLSGIAFLTWCIYFFIKLQKDTILKNTLLTVMAFYLFISSAHPGLIISSIYFFIGFLIFTYFQNELHNGWRSKTATYIKANLLLLCCLLFISAGMIVSYLDIIPYFVRGAKLSLTASVENVSPADSWISMLLPFSTVKNNSLLNADPSMRNTYMGLTILIFLIYGLFRNKTRWQWFFLITGVVFLLLTTGGIFKTAAYYLLPMMSYVRLNGIYSGVAILCFILFAAVEINKHISNKREFTGALRNICFILLGILLISIGYGLVKAILSHESILYTFNKVRIAPSFAKALVDTLTFYDTIWIQGLLQLVFLTAIILSLKRKKYSLLVYICIADMIAASLMNIPFTGAGNASVADVQNILNRAPKGIPIPALQPIIQNDTMTAAENGLTGDWSMYGKQPGITHEIAYPVTLKNAKRYFESIRSLPALSYMDKPLIFPDIIQPGESPVITSYKPGEISFNYNSPGNGFMIFQQNYYPYWYYYNGQVHSVEEAGINFIKVPLTPGTNKVTIFFNPKKIKAGMLISLVSFCILLLGIMICKKRKQFMHSSF